MEPTGLPKRLDGKLAGVIAKTRAKLGLTERVLAKRAGVSLRQLREIVQGSNTTVLRVIALAQALALTEVDLGGDLVAHVDSRTLTASALDGVLRELSEIEARIRCVHEVVSQFVPRPKDQPKGRKR